MLRWVAGSIDRRCDPTGADVDRDLRAGAGHGSGCVRARGDRVAVLFMANVLGSVVSSAGGGAGEVLIDVVVLLAPLMFFGGLFTGVPRTAGVGSRHRWIHSPTWTSAFTGALGGVATFDDQKVMLWRRCVTIARAR